MVETLIPLLSTSAHLEIPYLPSEGDLKKAREFESARNYVEGLFIGEIDEHTPSSKEELEKLAMRNARRLTQKLFGWNLFERDQGKIMHEIKIANALYELGLIPPYKDTLLATNKLAQASMLSPIILRPKRRILTIEETNGGFPSREVGRHYYVRSRSVVW